jgi:toxin-antitoxin system, antitoxin component, xre family
MEKNINRIKVVLAEKNLPNKWLVEQLDVSPTMVSKWVTNTSKPPMETFMKIAQLLKVDINELLRFKELEGNKEK